MRDDGHPTDHDANNDLGKAVMANEYLWHQS